jgi:hypothetical protein
MWDERASTNYDDRTSTDGTLRMQLDGGTVLYQVEYNLEMMLDAAGA